MANNPTLLTQPIAANGAKNVIPNTTSTAGAMSQDQGFPAETALPLGAGGVAPSREDFNGAFNLLSGIAFMAQKGWVFLFDENQDYFAGCTVRDPLDGKLYEAINDVSASSTHPSADSVNWKIADLSVYLPLTGGTMTPTGGASAAGIADAFLKRSVNTKELYLYGGTSYSDGAILGLRGNDCSLYNAEEKGSFALLAGGSNGKALVGRTDGGLLWDTKPVLYPIATYSWSNGEEWYIGYKYPDGEFIMSGYGVQAANILGITLTYPIPLVEEVRANATIVARPGTAYCGLVSFTYGTTTVGYFTIREYNYATPTDRVGICYTIKGRWTA